MMQDREDFFSPEQVDERLDFSLRLRETEVNNQSRAKADSNLLLVNDLSYFYGSEGTENVRSLQRVWERLGEQRTAAHLSPKTDRHLHLLKPHEEIMARKVRNRHMPGRGLAALAAVLFLMVMVGSLFALIHLTRSTLAGSNPATASTPIQQATPAQPVRIPGYPYPTPGKSIAVSPASPDDFYALAWSPDGKRLAASTQGKVWLWDVINNQYRPLINALAPGASVKALSWSPDGRYLAVGSNPIQVVDPNSGKVLWSYSADYPYLPVPGQNTLVTALAWSPDESMLAMATQRFDSQCFVNVWNARTISPIYSFSDSKCSRGISSISWSSDSKYVASADTHSVQAWDAKSGFSIFQHAIDASTNVAWSPGESNAGELAFVNNGRTEIWNVWKQANGPVSSSPGTANGVLAWSPDGNYVATASGNLVIIENAASGARLYTYSGDNRYVRTLAWSPDGNYVVSGESSTSGHSFARVWSA